MSEYLSKEEIKQWRSSLEKITLEEFAARLGKKIAEDKPTNDLADIVLHGQPVTAAEDSWNQPKTERISSIAQRAYERELEIAPSMFSITKLKLSLNENNNKEKVKVKEPKASKKSADKKLENKSIEEIAKSALKMTEISDKVVEKSAKTKTAKPKKTSTKSSVKAPKIAKAVKAVKEVLSAKPTGNELKDEVRVVFKKALTDREQRVFDYFSEHQNEVVYAKDLATLLNLPRDYVYKYIKNLRAKIEGDKLKNDPSGGFVLTD
jgi:DNA-binding CsgD family transcriptional regulator